jgi:hypothetical protein
MKTTENKLAFWGWVGLLLMLILAYCTNPHAVTDPGPDVVERHPIDTTNN